MTSEQKQGYELTPRGIWQLATDVKESMEKMLSLGVGCTSSFLREYKQFWKLRKGARPRAVEGYAGYEEVVAAGTKLLAAMQKTVAAIEEMEKKQRLSEARAKYGVAMRQVRELSLSCLSEVWETHEADVTVAIDRLNSHLNAGDLGSFSNELPELYALLEVVRKNDRELTLRLVDELAPRSRQFFARAS